MKILAAVVTYNRCELLQRCLRNIELQSRKPDSVLVINNSSTDGTSEMLTRRASRFITQENLGSAGGWSRCIEVALDEGFDAVWLMDDDGYPDRQSLLALEEALLPGISCVSSIVVNEENPEEFVFPYPILDSCGLPILFGIPRKLFSVTDLAALSKSGTYPFAHLFNGALIDINSVRKVGNVETGFFMFGDELDYFYRLRDVGRVCSVIKAVHMHPDVRSRPYTPAKIYYYVKNTLILHHRYFDWVWLRNVLALVAVFGRVAKRNGAAEAMSLLVGKNSSIFYAAIIRGLMGKPGKDFNG